MNYRNLSVRSKKLKELKERWGPQAIKLREPSPFGLTDRGLHDFRGIGFRDTDLSNEKIFDSDFSYADFDELRIKDSSFKNCVFFKAILTRISVWKGCFQFCEFEKSDMRRAHLGFGGTYIENCSFKGANVRNTSLINTIFRNIEFEGNTWSKTDFGASGFWNCSFSGVLSDVMFRGNHLLPSAKMQFGKAKDTGLHNVSFENAVLQWVGFDEYCELENIILPSNGEAFVCRTDNLIEFLTKLTPDTKEQRMLQKYVRIICPDPDTQPLRMVIKSDMQQMGESDTCAVLFDLMVARLAITV